MADVPMGSGETKAPSQCHDRELFAPLHVFSCSDPSRFRQWGLSSRPSVFPSEHTDLGFLDTVWEVMVLALR